MWFPIRSVVDIEIDGYWRSGLVIGRYGVDDNKLIVMLHREDIDGDGADDEHYECKDIYDIENGNVVPVVNEDGDHEMDPCL